MSCGKCWRSSTTIREFWLSTASSSGEFELLWITPLQLKFYRICYVNRRAPSLVSRASQLNILGFSTAYGHPATAASPA